MHKKNDAKGSSLHLRWPTSFVRLCIQHTHTHTHDHPHYPTCVVNLSDKLGLGAKREFLPLPPPVLHMCSASVHTQEERKKAKWSLRALKNIFTSTPQEAPFKHPSENERPCLCVSVCVCRLKVTNWRNLSMWCLFSGMSDSPTLDISLGDLTCTVPLKVVCVMESMCAFADHTNIACVLHVYIHRPDTGFVLVWCFSAYPVYLLKNSACCNASTLFPRTHAWQPSPKAGKQMWFGKIGGY